MIGEIITGGLSLLGGLFGGKKKEKVTNEVDYVKMAANAQAAGFNPLTVLRNGGSAGFGVTTIHPGLSMDWDRVAQGAGMLAGGLAQRFDPIEAKRRTVESALYDYQLGTIQAASKRPMMFGDVPTKTGSRVAVQTTPKISARGSAPASAVAASDKTGVSYFDPPKAGKDDMPMWVAGKDRDGKRVWVANPDLPDLDQYVVPWLSRAGAGAEAAAKSVMHWRQDTTIRKLNAAEKKKQEESWLPKWLPSFKFSW